MGMNVDVACIAYEIRFENCGSLVCACLCVCVFELFGAIREINIRPPAAICLGSRLMRARHKKNS